MRYNHRRVRDLPLFRTTQWGWFITCMVYSYGHFFLEEHRYPLIVGAGELSRGSGLGSLLSAPLRTTWAHACWLLAKVPPAASPAAAPRASAAPSAITAHAGRQVLPYVDLLSLGLYSALLMTFVFTLKPNYYRSAVRRAGARCVLAPSALAMLAGTRWASWRGRSPRS